MTPSISIVINAYNAQAAIERQLERWRGYGAATRAALEFVVVDDGSTPPLQVDPAALGAGTRLVLARVGPDIAWNMPGARNLGALLARGDFLLFHDVDHFLPEPSLQQLLQAAPALDRSTLYRFRRLEDGAVINPHINSFVCTRDGFWQAGGYDEDFAGHYGHEDSFFLGTWSARVGALGLLEPVWLEVLPSLSTVGLDRDTRRNVALFQHKRQQPLTGAGTRLRFPWSVQVRQA